MTMPHSLPDFTRLNDSVHFRKGASEPGLRSDGGEHPKLVLFLSWGGAPLRLVGKYTNEYARLFPSSPVLLVQTEFKHLLRHTASSQDVPLEPALNIIDSHVRDATSTNTIQAPNRILVHLFSNGGSYKLIEICKRYKSRHGTCLPMDTLILDSAPGISTIVRSFKALSYALPKLWLFRWPLQVLLFVSLIIQRLVERRILGEGLIQKFRRQMNDPALLDKTAKRCYIYGPGDELVGWQDVKDHAADARKAGYSTTEQVFEGTPHVAHMRAYPERYWRVVSEAWKHTQPRV